jgi:hypothetical protein
MFGFFSKIFSSAKSGVQALENHIHLTGTTHLHIATPSVTIASPVAPSVPVVAPVVAPAPIAPVAPLPAPAIAIPAPVAAPPLVTPAGQYVLVPLASATPAEIAAYTQVTNS